MLTSYEVGSIFKVIDQASPTLRLMARQFGELDALIVKTHKNLASFSSARFAGLGTSIKAINEQMAALGVSSEKALGGLMAGFGAMGKEIDTAAAGVRVLKTEMAQLAAEMKGIGRVNMLPGGGGGGGGAGGGRSPRRPGGGGHGGGGLPHFGMYQHIPGGLHMSGGGDAFMAAFIAGLAADHIEKAGETLIHSQNQLEAALPMTTAAMDMAIAKTVAYAEAGKNLNSTFSGNIESLKDLYRVLQSMPEAARLLPAMNTINTAMSFAKDGNAHNFGTDTKNTAALARAFDLTGRTTEESIAKIARDYIGTATVLGENASGPKFLTTVRGLGAAGQSLSNGFLTQVLPELMNGGLGTGAGNTISMLYKNIFGGHTSNEGMAAAMVAAGIQKDENRIVVDGKQTKDFKPGSGFEAEVFRTDPLKWSNDLLAMWKKTGFADPANQDQMAKKIAEVWSAQKTYWKGMDEFLLPNSNAMLNRGQKNIADAAGNLENIEENDPVMWRSRLAKQWTNLEEAFGASMVDPFINKIIKPLTLTLRDLAQIGVTDGLYEKLKLLAPMVGQLLLAGNPIYNLYKKIIDGAKENIPPMIDDAKSWIVKAFKEIGPALEAALPSSSDIVHAMQGFGASMKAAIFAFFDGIGAWAKEKLGSLFSHINYDGGGGGGGGGGIFNAAYHPGIAHNDNIGAMLGGGGGGGGGGVGGAIPHSPTANVAGFQPVFKERMAAMMAAAKAAGVPLSVFSGYRSQAHQNALFAHSDGSGHMVARHSNHTRGIAADLRGNLGWAHAHAHEFGLKFPMPWEKWHIEPQESRGGARWHGHVKPYVKPHDSHPQTLNVMLDGEVIHRSVVKHERRATEHSHQAPTFDGYHDFSAPDGQIWAA